MNTINLLIATAIIPDDHSRSKSEDRYNATFLPIESFERVFADEIEDV
jgi:hypothetical protein